MEPVIAIDEPLEGLVGSVGSGRDEVVGLVEVLSGSLVQDIVLFYVEIKVLVFGS